jgi:hypothetical protein
MLYTDRSRRREAAMHKHLSYDEKATAYRAITDRFHLRHQARDALDVAPTFRAIRQAAHDGDWATVEKLLHEAGVIYSEAYAR